MAIDLLLLVCMTMGLGPSSLISLKYFESQSACVIMQEKAINLALTVDSATISYFFVFHETSPPATKKMFSFVNCLVFLHPVKSKFT